LPKIETLAYLPEDINEVTELFETGCSSLTWLEIRDAPKWMEPFPARCLDAILPPLLKPVCCLPKLEWMRVPERSLTWDSISSQREPRLFSEDGLFSLKDL